MNGPLILVVDDERSISEVVSLYLTRAGYRVKVAHDGAAALQALAAQKPDLVILDINMPGLNGIEVLRRMKEQRPDLPVILNSAYQEFKQDLGAWASDAYVVKSYDIDELKETVRRLLT